MRSFIATALRSGIRSAVFTLFVAGLILVSGVAVAQEAKPFKIGVLAPLTGPQTQLGQNLVAGVRFFFQQRPAIAGRSVQLVVEDTVSQPGQGLSKARKLLDLDRVDIVMGIVNSAVLDAVQGMILGRRVPLIVTNAGSDGFTKGSVNRYAFRVSHTNSQNNLALGWYAYEKLGYRRAAVLTYDFIAGVEHAGGFKKTFTEMGGTITQEVKAPLGTSDFGPYISQIRTGEIDVLYVFLAGADAIRFMQQADSFGLKNRTKIIGPGFVADDLILAAQRDAAVGVVTAIQYVNTIDTPENREFTAAYRKATGQEANLYAEDAYTACEAVAKALEEVRGDTSDISRFVNALESVKFTSPRGPFRFDKNHQAVFTVYVARVTKIGTQYRNTIIDQIPDVGQDWSPASRPQPSRPQGR
ncbi:MAG: ABC transporter substrate-binding protein [Candidatus Tectomicrobia bacterium]|uniref:ABC transporter substrate-binding protein n=1 Tax=Tectimicrobiota bacterium TaxID=2528274 RepID=A0A932GR43_UNCTE|nr:ABC transporter substrate-binding protein [Candidatus Tectomicrobia bacterium]